MEALPNDIEPAVEIINYSFIYFSSSIGLGLVFLYFTIKFILNLFHNRRNSKKEMVATLKEMDWSDSKGSAYKVTRLGRAVSSSERSRKLLDEIIESLEVYKYRSSVPEIDQSIISKFNIFLEVVESE